MTDFERLLGALTAGGVEYIVIGGIAANAHGAIRTTRDVDVVYARARANLGRPKDFEAIAELEALRQERRS